MKSDQSAGDSAILVSATGNVSIVSGLTVTEAKDLFRLMLKDSLAGLQAEAMATAEARNEKLLNDFMEAAESRFGEQIESKLSEFRDPGAQYAFRSAQTEYCKYGDNTSEEDAIQLIMDRLEISGQSIEKVVIDEALKICGKLPEKSLDLLIFYLLAYHVIVPPTVIRQRSEFEEFIKKLGSHLGGLDCSDSMLGFMAHLGVISIHPGGAHWKPLGEVFTSRFVGYFVKPLPREAYGLSGHSCEGYLWPAKDGLFIPPSLTSIWRALLEKNYSEDIVNAAINVAESNTLSSDAAYDSVAEISKPFDERRHILQNANDGILSYRLTSVGIALALARARALGWTVPVRLSLLVS